MAEANPSLNSNNKNPRNQIKLLKNNTKHLKQEINDRVDFLIASIDSQRMKLLNQVDSEFHKAIKPLKNFENKNAARIEARERLKKELEGDITLLRRLTSEIDEELAKMEVDLPNFKIQWNSKFFRFCGDVEEVGELKVEKHSRREDFEKVVQLKIDTHSRREEFEKVVQLKIDKHSRREVSNTPLWSTLNRGKADNEIGEPKAIAIDTETSNIYVGDASAGKILVMDKTGKYLNTLTFKKPSSIRSMVICKNFIYCRSNGFWHNTIFQLYKETGMLLSKYDSILPIYSLTAVPNQVFFCQVYTLATLSPNLTDCKVINNLLSDSKTNKSEFRNVQSVSEELVTLITDNPGYSIHVFDKKGVFLRVITEQIKIPLDNLVLDVQMCIDEYWTIYISIDGDKLNIYNKDGKFLTSVGQRGDEYSGIYHPRDIALDRDGNLVVCSNRKQDILQAYKMTN